jgi:hypothetical protein
MAKAKTRKRAPKPNKASHLITVRLGRTEQQVLARVAQLAGVPVSTVAAVILAQGVLVELGKINAARKRP